MNAGLGNLATLTTSLLPDALQPDTQWSALLLSIGRGVAASFERFCNRKFGYVQNDVHETTADRRYVSLPRFPLTGVQDILQSDTADQGFYTLGDPTDVALQIAFDTGLVEFGYITGPFFSRLKFLYSGGYWFETLEPADEGYPSALPAGAVCLPADLLDAWLEQSQFLFTQRDILGQRAVKKQGRESTGDFRIAEIPMVQHVQDILGQYIRYVA